MAEKKDGMNKRTTANEIKKLFYTAVRGNMLFIYDNKTKNLLLQSRIIPEADPIVTMQYATDLARRLKKYVEEARKDINKTTFE